ncbi:hypothetical protein [Mycoplasma hafezii]|uniref:hypothetical protein n=1 Tax=Mycoplasma hafezii TaxID=525886 RepID=UPI003CF8E981
MSYKSKDIVIGKVIRTGLKYAIVETKDKANFIIYKQEVSDYPRSKVNDILRLNDIINFVVLKFDETTNKGVASFKRNHPTFMDTPFLYRLKETPSGFKNLKEFTFQTIINDNSKSQ